MFQYIITIHILGNLIFAWEVAKFFLDALVSDITVWGKIGCHHSLQFQFCSGMIGLDESVLKVSFESYRLLAVEKMTLSGWDPLFWLGEKAIKVRRC